jgi:hypothetical protein
MGADGYAADVEHDAVVVEERVRTYVEVVSIVTEERPLHPEVVSRIREQLLA